MLKLKVFIFKLITVDTLSSCSVVVGEISSLAHELGNDTMKGGSSVTESWLSRAKLTEVLRRLGDYVSTQFHNDASGCLSADGDVEVNLGIGPDDLYISFQKRITKSVGFLKKIFILSL